MINPIDIGEQKSCDSCGSTSHHQITHKRNFKIHRCRDCNLIFVHPQPEMSELESLYDTSQGYFATAERSLSETSSSNAVKLDEILTSRLSTRGKFLDIGCSNGKLIYHMRNLGWDVSGNDLNAGALEIAKAHDLNVMLGSLRECGFEESSFDAIHLGDLIEHVPSPSEIFESIEKLLKPNGIVTIATPNSKSGFARYSLLSSRLTGLAWPHSEAPHHLYDFNPDSIKALLASTGITINDIQYKSGGRFTYIVGGTGYFDNLKKSLKIGGKYKISWRVLPKLPQLILVSAWLLPIWWLGLASDKINHSGKSMLVIGQRKP